MCTYLGTHSNNCVPLRTPKSQRHLRTVTLTNSVRWTDVRALFMLPLTFLLVISGICGKWRIGKWGNAYLKRSDGDSNPKTRPEVKELKAAQTTNSGREIKASTNPRIFNAILMLFLRPSKHKWTRNPQSAT